MRILILAAWLLLLPIAFAYHMGPGQTQNTLDSVADRLRMAEELVAEQNHASAASAYEEALKMLPPDRKAEARAIRLERAKALMLAKRLPEAHSDLKALVDEVQADPTADPKLRDAAQATLANSQYYMTWLMRLEGLGREDWEPEIESARQLYKLLAEQAEAAGQHDISRKHREDLEATIRLARLDLSDLQGLPLPSQ